MDKLSIESLFPSDEIEKGKSYNNGKLDIDTLFGNNKLNKDPDRSFDSSVLIKNIIDKRKRLRKWYVNMYNVCCKNIKSANDCNLQDVIFTLPEIVPECPDFDHVDCLRYISKHLREECIDTHIIDSRRIFITWVNIEMNKVLKKV